MKAKRAWVVFDPRGRARSAGSTAAEAWFYAWVRAFSSMEKDRWISDSKAEGWTCDRMVEAPKKRRATK